MCLGGILVFLCIFEVGFISRIVWGFVFGNVVGLFFLVIVFFIIRIVVRRVFWVVFCFLVIILG